MNWVSQAHATNLVREHENEQRRVLRSFFDARRSDHVLRKRHIRQVFLVLVLLVDDLRQVLAVDLHGVSHHFFFFWTARTYLFLVDIHVHPGLKHIRVASGVVS